MSMFDVTSLFSRVLQQVSNGASRAGNWTRGQVLNIRRKRPKSAEAAASASTAATSTTATETTTSAPTTSKNKSTSKQKPATNGESSKCQSKR